MVEEDFGEATIVYEDPDDGTIERTVENEHIAYFQDHWIVKIGEAEDDGRDRIRRIPAQRVYYVERSVEEFEAEISTFADQVRSFTEEIREKLPVGGEPQRQRPRREHGPEDPVDIEVDAGDEDGGGSPASDATDDRP